MADKIFAHAVRSGRAGKLELRVRRQTVQNDGLKRAWSDAEIHKIPTIALAHRGVELELDGELAATVEGDDIFALINAHTPFRIGADS